MIGNFTEIKPLHYWVQHILPLVYDDSLSHMELLSKVVKLINELIQNNNLLPEYIKELIKQYITSGEFSKILSDILANYMLNVKYPPSGLTPAVGDGTADDTESIQGCIDYAYSHGGMAVYFPSGSYLSQSLVLKDKATLFGHDRYTTRIVMKGGATKPLFSGIVNQLTLNGLGFDGNMDIQINNVNLFTLALDSAIINNCYFTDGYELLNATINNDLQLTNCIFNHAVVNGLVLKGAGRVQADNLIFESVSELVGKNFIVCGVSNSILEKIMLKAVSPTGITVTGSNNIVKFWNGGSTTPFNDSGENNSFTIYDESETLKLKGDSTLSVANLTQNVLGSLTVNAENIEYTVDNLNTHIKANVTEKVDGTKTVTVTNGEIHNGKRMAILTADPLQYSKPVNNTNFNPYFSYVPMLDTDGNQYNVLVNNTDTLKLWPEINVKSFGGKGDGITDDTEAINKALAFLSSNGCLYFPSGTYIVSAKIQLGGNITVRGDGINNTVIKLANKINTSVIGTSDDGIKRYYVCIRDIGIDGNAANQTAGHCIELFNVTESKIMNVRIFAPKQDGIYIGGTECIAPVIDNCFIRGDVTHTTGNGIECESGASDLMLTNVDVGWFTKGAGLLLSGCEGSSVINLMNWQCKVGLKLYATERTRIVNCLSDLSKTWGYVFQRSGTLQIANCQAREYSQDLNNGFDGFFFDGEKDNIMTKVLLSNCIAYSVMGRSGLNIGGNTNNFKISNCDFSGNNVNIINISTGNMISIDKATIGGNNIMTNIAFTTHETITLSMEQANNTIINMYGGDDTNKIVNLPKDYYVRIVRNSTASSVTLRPTGKTTGGLNVAMNQTVVAFYNGSDIQSINIPSVDSAIATINETLSSYNTRITELENKGAI